MRSGLVAPGSNLGDAGESGYYWSSQASSNTNSAYYLGFWGSGVYPSRYVGGNRYAGLSLRCLIPTT